VEVRRPLQAGIAGVVVLLDQATKAMVRSRFDLHESVTVIPGFFDLTRVHNTGVAFGFLDPVDFPFKSVVLALVPLAALTGLALYSISLEPAHRLTRLGLAFVIGGAAGNLIDRVTAGYVLDFVDLYQGGWHFWAFNAADVAINVGVALMILELLVPRLGRTGHPGPESTVS
jgi:signal peptidase II